MAAIPHISPEWWKEASLYQIYPASFKDSNDDGIGDIPGIISKLDYIKALGVDILWISPITQSPQVDMGYDVSDYRAIYPPYGTMVDVENLIEGLKSRSIKFVMDMVFNHTSDQHEWFQKSKSSIDNEYRNYYIWKKPKYNANGERQPPNNWRADFVGSAWTYDEQTEEYYLGIYSPKQPDLNWEHPPVREAVYDILNFWMDQGVDGLDVINQISKVPELPDAPVIRPDLEFQPGHQFYSCGPHLHEYLAEIGSVLRKRGAFSIREMPCVEHPKEIIKAVATDRKELDMIINFDLMSTDVGSFMKFSHKDWKLTAFKETVEKWQIFMIENGGWNALNLENHDNGRSVSRWGSDLPEYRVVCAKMLATCLALQSGTVFVYQGQELGMINIPDERSFDNFRDLETINAWNELLESHPTESEKQIMKREIHLKSRDNARTPMQWDTSAHGGFSTVTPWQEENPSYHIINAEAQVNVPGSVFEYWKSVLKLRKAHLHIFVYGDFQLIDATSQQVFAYTRNHADTTVVVVCNFGKDLVEWEIPRNVELLGGEVLLHNYSNPELSGRKLRLRPFEAFACFARVRAN